eukprot:PhF_6_TR5193/c0_g1_i2/m.7473
MAIQVQFRWVLLGLVLGIAAAFATGPMVFKVTSFESVGTNPNHRKPYDTSRFDILKSFDFLQAVRDKDIAAVKTFLEDPQVNVQYATHEGCAFHIAIHNYDQSIPMVRLLLSHPEANPNGSPHSWSPLQSAIHQGNTELSLMLLNDPRTRQVLRAEFTPCTAVDWLPASVVIKDPGGRHPCFANYPNVDTTEDHPQHHHHQPASSTTWQYVQQNYFDSTRMMSTLKLVLRCVYCSGLCLGFVFLWITLMSCGRR